MLLLGCSRMKKRHKSSHSATRWLGSEFHRYPQSSNLRSELARLAGEPGFFTALKSCDSRIAVGQPIDVPALSIPTELRRVWAFAASVQFNGDSILYSWRESEKIHRFLADV